MDSLERLKRALLATMKANVPVQTLWAQCQSVNLQEGTMVATREGLDYEDVLLGLGPDITVPELGSKVLLGLVENQRAATFLLFAERIAERRINGNAHGGLVRANEVAKEFAIIQQEINALKQVLIAWVPVPSDGGAALKAASASWSAQPLMTTLSQQLQNPKVSHG